MDETKIKRKIEGKVKKNIAFHQETVSSLQSETLRVNEMRLIITIPKRQLYFSDKTFQEFKTEYIWLILESTRREENMKHNHFNRVTKPKLSSQGASYSHFSLLFHETFLSFALVSCNVIIIYA